MEDGEEDDFEGVVDHARERDVGEDDVGFDWEEQLADVIRIHRVQHHCR